MKWLHLFDVYRKGRALANPGAWTAGAIAAEIAAFLVALSAFAVAFGWVQAPISQEQALEIGLGISTLVGWLSTHVHLGSSKQVGIGRAPDPGPAIEEAPREPIPPRDYAPVSRRTRAVRPRSPLGPTSPDAPVLPSNPAPSRHERHPGDDPGLDDFR